MVQTREFLVELSRNTDLSEAIRKETKRLLRHFPSKADVLLAGKIEEQAGHSIFEPIFISSTMGDRPQPWHQCLPEGPEGPGDLGRLTADALRCWASCTQWTCGLNFALAMLSCIAKGEARWTTTRN
ncbi:BPSL0761 family protein [Pseudomonas sp. D(2018)]|uniref:BPSL0761 family protein n=1 Tax=Pseudomonas sp. D(2018) TaxID=2502238 RepID=UPI00273D43F8|nr:BPSL0761 family protein [Pseudomonas sp. D(2018)]